MHCLFHLGYGASNEDAEDALQDFCATHRQKVIDTYKSGAQSPVDYFKLCLKRFCWRRARQLRRRRIDQESLTNSLQLINGRDDSSPIDKILTEAHQRERDKQESRLVEAVAQLSPDRQNLLWLN